MERTQSLPFADLLRRYRSAADLTQEDLAERAHLSRKAISAPVDHAVQAVREALGVVAFAEAWAEGAQLPLEQAIAAALTPI